jgi:predicted aldo/keto reductase-like oxidoreductase
MTSRYLVSYYDKKARVYSKAPVYANDSTDAKRIFKKRMKRLKLDDTTVIKSAKKS